MELLIRKLLRLKNYDYSTPGTYFVTIRTHDKQCLFGKVIPVHGADPAHMQYSPIGEIAKKCLLDIGAHYDNVKIDKWVIMPNHVHMLIRITERINPLPYGYSVMTIRRECIYTNTD